MQPAIAVAAFKARPSAVTHLTGAVRNDVRMIGDITLPGVLESALQHHASTSRGIIFMLSDHHHLRLAHNLLLNLRSLGLHHHILIGSSVSVCTSLKALSLVHTGCAHSSFLARGRRRDVDQGLKLYKIADDHVYHLWWQRWYFLSRASALGYTVLSLDTDISLRVDPYPLFLSAFSNYELIFALDTDRPTYPAYFPQINAGLVFFRGSRDGTAQWVLAETARRLEALLSGVGEVPWPQEKRPAQQVVWDQDVLKDVVETAAFGNVTGAGTRSYRHSWMHRHGWVREARRATPLRPGVGWRRQNLSSFGPTALPYLWLPLRSPQLTRGNKDAGFGELRRASKGGEQTAIGDGVTRREAPAEADAKAAALPMWFCASYNNCPHGNECDGRWAGGAPPILIGHFVGTKLKFYLMRILGWWDFAAERVRIDRAAITTRVNSPVTAPATSPAASSTAAPSFNSAAVSSVDIIPSDTSTTAAASAAVSVVFPPHVRPLALRGHRLSLRGDDAAIHRQYVWTYRWLLLALILGRRAVLPAVPCVMTELPSLVPRALRDYAALVKLADPTLCDADARRPSWFAPPTVSPHASPATLGRSEEMQWLGGEGSSTVQRPPSGCCQVVPLHCIDQYGASGHALHEELLLNERDLGQLIHEQPHERPQAQRLAPLPSGAPSEGERSGDELRALLSRTTARTLIVDVAGGRLRLPRLRSLLRAAEEVGIAANLTHAKRCLRQISKYVQTHSGKYSFVR